MTDVYKIKAQFSLCTDVVVSSLRVDECTFIICVSAPVTHRRHHSSPIVALSLLLSFSVSLFLSFSLSLSLSLFRGVVGKAPLPLARACRRGVVPRFVEQQVAAKVLSVTHGGPFPVGDKPLRNMGSVFRKLHQANPSCQCPADTEPCWSDQAHIL